MKWRHSRSGCLGTVTSCKRGSEISGREHFVGDRTGKNLRFPFVRPNPRRHAFSRLAYFNHAVLPYHITRWHNWLRHCATSRKVADSIPDGFIGNFRYYKYKYIYILIYLTAIGLTLGGSSTSHIYTQTIHNTEKGKFGKCGPCPVFASYTLAFALQLR
jgi:hypothetical protein